MKEFGIRLLYKTRNSFIAQKCPPTVPTWAAFLVFA